jgi:hypothetical protein
MDIKMRINQILTSTKDLGIFDINDEDKVRVVVENAGSGNTIVVSGRITGQSSFVPLKTITGSSNEVVNVSTYEEIKIECTVFSALSNAGVKLLAASFKEAGGSAIESIGVPSGTDLTDIEVLTFTSDDGSVTITGDNTNKSIDFSVAIPDVPVLSVNTKTGHVVLDKTDIGLGNVDNTSDADKPISDDTQDALDGLDTRIEALEDTSEVIRFHVFENNASIYADGMPGIRDTSTLIRDGWYFQNATGQKINWYFFDGNPLSSNYQGAITQANFNAYIVMTLDNKNSKPIIALYSLPTGTGDALFGFAHSRWIYELSTTALSPLSAGTKYLFYIGTNPPVHPELQHIALDLVPVQSIGDKNPSELILTAALNSSSAEPAGEVSWMVESLGVFSPTRKQEMELRIRTVPLNSASKIDSIYLPSYVDDVLEYANLAAFPTIGETGKIYVTLDTNKIYRWSGSAYVEISPGAIPPVTSVNTKTGDVVLDKTDIGLGNVDNTSDADKPISDDTQDALDLKYDASNPAGYITSAQAPVISVNQQTGNVILDKYDIGLGNVDNTSDLNKPISNATQAALDLITDVNWTGDYNNGVTYNVGDGVMYNGASFRMINFIGAAGYPPPAYPGSWLQVTDYISVNVDNKANTNLDNLIETSIPDGVGLNSLATSNFNIKTIDKEGSTASVTISSGDSTVTGNSGDIILSTGEVTSGSKGLVKLKNNTRLILQDNIGDKLVRLQLSNGVTEGYGQFFFNRIRSDKEVFIGAMESHVDDDGAPVVFSGTFLLSDTDGQYKTSDVSLQTLSNSGFRDADNVAVSSGNINITTHNSFVQGTETDANTGNITIKTGTPSGSGSRGNIELNAKGITANVDYYNGLVVRNPSGLSNVDISTTGFGAPDNPQINFNGVASGGVAAIQAFSRPNNNGGTTYLTSTMVYANADGNYNGGNLNLTAGSNAFEGITADNASVSSGSVNITTSNAFSQGSATDANSGNIVIQTGNKEGAGTRGYVSLSGSHINANLAQIKNVADGTDNNDAVNVSQLNAVLDYTPADTLDWISPVPDDIKEALDQLADRLQSGSGVSLDAFEDMKEPTGFLNRTDSTLGLSYNSGTNTVTFTITPVVTNFQFYVKGTKYTKSSAESIQIASPTAGIHYLYYNSTGVLSHTTIFSTSLFEDNALVSLFYWNTDTNSYIYFAEERHGLTMDGATHAYLHTVLGARYLSGLALQGFTIGNGSLDSHAQFTADSGSIRDEDILHVINAQTQIPILFRQGQLWRKKSADNFPVIYSGSAEYTGANGRLPYNEYTGGAWQLTQVASNKFVLVHLFATNDIENKIVGIQGINQYNDAPAARNAASTEITTLSDLPFAEFVPIGTVIFQTNTYANAIDARIVNINGANYVDFRGTQLYTPAGEATEHSLLSGLADDDHIQYHTDARGDARYNLKSSGDISETSFSITQNQLTQTVLGFSFNNAIVRSFEAIASVSINATASLYEEFTIKGIQKGSNWFISISSIGDNCGVYFTINSSGQVLYTSPTYSGFVSGVIKFRALTTSV